MNLEDYYVPIIALLWFISCWSGYSFIASFKARKSLSLTTVLEDHCIDWMKRMMKRENRVADSSLVRSLSANTSFFMSSSLIIVAGILATLGSIDKTVGILSGMPFIKDSTKGLIELKVIGLSLLFIYSFFTLSWSMRQYNLVTILLGSAPILGETGISERRKTAFILSTGKILTIANNHFNYGLRAYYFGMGYLSWFISDWLFMVVTAFISVILYRREFHSDLLKILTYKNAE